MNGWLVVIELGALNGLALFWAVLGFSVSFRLLSFADLTVEASLPLGAGIYAVLVIQGVASFVAAPLAMLGGAMAGALTASLNVWLRLNRLLAGVIVIAIGYSLNLAIMHAPNIGLLAGQSLFGGLADRGVLLTMLVATAAILPLASWFLSSKAGLRMRAAGGNREFASSLGISPGVQIVCAVAGANGLVALSGILLASYQGFADVGMGQGVLVMALAALGIGEAFPWIRRLPAHMAVLVAALTGSLLYQTALASALRLGLPATYLKLVTGLLVLAMVTIQALRSPQPLWREVLD
jgi:putative ABC transport system permease protein